jgi:hypothetical protein
MDEDNEAMTNHHMAVYFKGKLVWFYGSQNEDFKVKDVKIKKYKGLITPPMELEE